MVCYNGVVINWSRRSYTKEEFIDAWTTSSNIRQVAEKLGKCKSGRGYYTIRTAAQDLNLTEEHMGPKEKRASIGRAIPLSEILVVGSSYTKTDTLRRRLIKEGILKPECSAEFCPFRGQRVVDPFSGKPRELRLCLDHVNGINTDNRLDNLRILCYHCHAMTPTFGSKNKSV